MAAKHKITKTKKTFKRKTVSRRKERPIENVIPDEIRPTVIPNNSFGSTQSIQPIQTAESIQKPIQPIQTPTVQAVQPMQTVPLSSSSQTIPVQESSSDISMKQPVSAAADPSSDTESSGAEPQIKIGIENKLASETEGKSSEQKLEFPSDSEEKNKSGQKNNLLIPIIFIVLLGSAIFGGLFIYRQNFSNKIEEKINEVSLSPAPTEKPTPKPLDLTKFEIRVLNGSGIAGEASSQQESLEDAGFKVASIGNADNSDYEGTVIQAKKEVDKAFLDKLKTTLEESFAVAGLEELDADADADEDVVVIIGSKKAE